MRARNLLGAIAAGLLIGVGLDLLTVALARWGPAGAVWSLRGNGALIVPFGLGPAALAGGWSAIVRHGRGAARPLAWGLGAALVGAALTSLGVLPLVALGAAGQPLAGLFGVAPLVWLIVAPLVAAIAPVRQRGGAGRPLISLAAGALYTIALIVGFIGASRLIAPM